MKDFVLHKTRLLHSILILVALALLIIGLLPNFVSAALINQGAISCTREILPMEASDYLLKERQSTSISQNFKDCENSKDEFQAAYHINQATSAQRWLILTNIYTSNYAGVKQILFDKPSDVSDNYWYGYFTAALIYKTSDYVSLLKKLDEPDTSLVGFGNALLKKGYTGQAAEFYKFVLEERSQSPYIELALAETLYKMGRYDEALTHYIFGLPTIKNSNKLVSLSEAYFHLGEIYNFQKQYMESIKAWETAIKLQPRSYYMGALVGLYLGLNNYEAAEHWLSEMKSIAPNSGLTYWAYGNYYMATKNYDKAIINYETAIKLEPKGPSVYYWALSNAYLSAGNPQRAKDALILALQLDPDNSNYKQDLQHIISLLNK